MKPYINCFTGSITHLVNQPNLSESDFLLFGEGFLLKSGLDEYGMPELVFNVINCGELALKRLNIKFSCQSPGSNIDFDELKQLCIEDTPGIIVWTNSSHLSYSSFYSKHLGYLHCIVIKEVNDNDLQVFDPLVVDIPPYATDAQLPFEYAKLALTDTAKMDARGVMGSLLKIHVKTHIDIDLETKYRQIVATAHKFVNTPEYYDAIYHYTSTNEEAYHAADDEQKKYLSRRIFDHIQVLYVIPLLELLKNEAYKPILKTSIDTEITQWKSVAMMALKNSKILDERLFDKIIFNLKECGRLRNEYWSRVVDEYKVVEKSLLS